MYVGLQNRDCAARDEALARKIKIDGAVRGRKRRENQGFFDGNCNTTVTPSLSLVIGHLSLVITYFLAIRMLHASPGVAGTIAAMVPGLGVRVRVALQDNDRQNIRKKTDADLLKQNRRKNQYFSLSNLCTMSALTTRLPG